jgi:hypothetical protein
VLDSVDNGFFPKLIDFNKARNIKDCAIKKLSPSEKSVYSNQYPHVAPEVVEGLAAKSPASDIFGLGYIVGRINRICRSEILEDIYIACVRRSPSCRPTAKEVLKYMKKQL